MTARLISLSSPTEQVRKIPLTKIRESLVTLRTEYNEEELKELGDSLAEKGQLQTIVVQPGEDDFYDLVIGSRRVRAAKLKGISDIAAYVIEKQSPVNLLFIALAENLHRADLNPFEEAQGFLRLMKEYGLSLKEVAKGINKHESYVRKRIQLLSLPEEVVSMVSERVLPIHSVQSLARLPTGEDQVRLARITVKHHLTQSEISAQVRKEMQEPARTEREFHELTPLKLQARIDEFIAFIQKAPRRMKMLRMNEAEKQSVSKALQALEDEAKQLREMIKYRSAYQATDNRGQQWTLKDISRINSPRRPSDEELSVELGRTVGAIRVMRGLTKDKKKG